MGYSKHSPCLGAIVQDINGERCEVYDLKCDPEGTIYVKLVYRDNRKTSWIFATETKPLSL